MVFAGPHPNKETHHARRMIPEARHCVVAVCGSLRADSANRLLLRRCGLLLRDQAFLARAAPGCEGLVIDVSFFDGLASLPAFVPETVPGVFPIQTIEGSREAVERWRNAVRLADAVMVASPEYAHGLPGALKNALDWIVASGELSQKPVLALGAAASGGEYARSQLTEILRTMDARVVEGPFLRTAVVREGCRSEGAAGSEGERIDGLLLSALFRLLEARDST